MKVWGLDFETTWVTPVDPKKMHIIEIGAVLWDTERKMPLKLNSVCVWDRAYPFDPGITELTGLSRVDLETMGHDPKFALEMLQVWMGEAEAIVAHNGLSFDKVVLESEAARHGVKLPELPWIDTIHDVPYPKKIETRKLDFLAPAHGFLNPFAHRALFDVLTMLRVMSFYSFEEILARKAIPDIMVRALVKKPFGPTAEQGKRETESAKTRSFRFTKYGETGVWEKRIKETEFEEEQRACLALPVPFKITRVELPK